MVISEGKLGLCQRFKTKIQIIFLSEILHYFILCVVLLFYLCGGHHWILTLYVITVNYNMTLCKCYFHDIHINIGIIDYVSALVP